MKQPKVSTLARKAWKLMSLRSRLKDADSLGFVACITCGQVKHYKEMHAGHFFHASKQRPVTYDDRNIHAQCPGCNKYKGGARDDYAVAIVKRYGPHTLQELHELKHQGKELKRADLCEVIERLSA